MSAHVEFYQEESNEGEEGQWRWRVKAGNGEIVATGEGHTRKEDARRAFETACSTMQAALHYLRAEERES